MNHVTVRSALLLLSVGAAGPLAAQSFEGVITVRTAISMPNGQPSPEIEYMTRAGKLRINVRSPMGSMGIIAAPAEQKMYLLMDAQSMYAEQPLDLSGAGNSATTAPKITRTGRKETIAGYECEHLLVAGDPGDTDICVTKGLGPYVTPSIGARLPAWQRALASEGAFPLKVTNPAGVVQLEVTKIEKRKLSPAQFEVPDNYSKVAMPAGRRPPGGARQ